MRIFSYFWKQFCFKQFPNSIFSGVSNEVSLNFIILNDSLSQACSLLLFGDVIMFRIFSSEIGESHIIEEGVGKFRKYATCFNCRRLE